MDGTLMDSNPTHQEAYTKFLKRYGIDLTDDDFKEQISGRMNPEIMKHFFGDDLADERIEALTQEKEKLFQELYAPRIKPVGGLLNFLNRAHDAHIRMALATSAPLMNVRFMYDHIPVESFFEQIVTDRDVTVGKPDPTVFRIAAERLGVEPRQCVVFEDSPAGVEAARCGHERRGAHHVAHARGTGQSRHRHWRLHPDFGGAGPAVGGAAGRRIVRVGLPKRRVRSKSKARTA